MEGFVQVLVEVGKLYLLIGDDACDAYYREDNIEEVVNDIHECHIGCKTYEVDIQDYINSETKVFNVVGLMADILEEVKHMDYCSISKEEYEYLLENE